MRRRRFVAAVGAGALAAVAGCAGGETDTGETPTASRTTTFPNPEGLAVAERVPAPGDPLGVETVVANGAEAERTGTLVAFARFDPDDGEAVSDERRREVTVAGRSSETFTVELDLDLPGGAATGTSTVDAYIEGNRRVGTAPLRGRSPPSGGRPLPGRRHGSGPGPGRTRPRSPGGPR